MATKKYMLTHDGTDIYVHKEFSKKFKGNFLERIESPIYKIHNWSKSEDEYSPRDIDIYDINDVCVDIYTQSRYVDINNNNFWWNLRMIGSKRNINELGKEIRLQGFTLEEII